MRLGQFLFGGAAYVCFSLLTWLLYLCFALPAVQAMLPGLQARAVDAWPFFGLVLAFLMLCVLYYVLDYIRDNYVS